MKNEPLIFNDTEIKPGESTTVELPLTKLYTHTNINLPIQIRHGKSAGPSLFVTGAIHGDEINGVEIIRRLLQHKSLQRLKGTLYAVPIVNVMGFLSRTRYTPDRRDLNRMFPGNEHGALASRLAYLLTDNVVKHCDYGIDLHTGSNHRTNLPQIRAVCTNETTRDLACAFGAPVIINTETRDGSLRQYASDQNIPILLYEAGEALRFDEAAIQLGVKGILAVMRGIGMLPKLKRVSKRKVDPIYTSKTAWVRANVSGVIAQKVKVGQVVTKGETLAVIVDPFSEFEKIVTTPVSGIVIGSLNLPLVHEGEALIHIARTSDTEEVETLLEETLSIDDFKMY